MSAEAPKIFEGKSYEEIRASLKTFPRTWYGDLLKTMVEAAIDKEVFIPGRISPFVARIEEEYNAKRNHRRKI
jgi:hypothetical protein